MSCELIYKKTFVKSAFIKELSCCVSCKFEMALIIKWWQTHMKGSKWMVVRMHFFERRLSLQFFFQFSTSQGFLHFLKPTKVPGTRTQRAIFPLLFLEQFNWKWKKNSSFLDMKWVQSNGRRNDKNSAAARKGHCHQQGCIILLINYNHFIGWFLASRQSSLWKLFFLLLRSEREKGKKLEM